jgi:transketolase
MRNAFIREFTTLAEEDSRSLLITGDLGFGVLTEFARRFPGQYINAGVAEQNMTALAVGLALEGRTVYTYSIGNFPTLRCLEQIRNDACYHNANIKIVTVGGGFAYGPLGISHHATEDLAIMRALPNLTVFSPGDPYEVAAITRLAHHTPGPCYLRLGRGGEPAVHTARPAVQLGRALVLAPAGEIALLSCGGMLAIATEVRQRLTAQGVTASLHSFPTLKPLDADLIRHLSRTCRVIATLEEHSKIGGLGGAVAEVLAEQPGRTAYLVRCGLDDIFSSIVGSQEYLRQRYHIDVEGVLDRLNPHFAVR